MFSSDKSVQAMCEGRDVGALMPLVVDSLLMEELAGIAGRAGAAIMDIYATEFSSWAKEDSSPLTEADLCADSVICDGLMRAFPGIPIVSEESKAGTVGFANEFFLVDPLDGTKEFLKRNGEFTVNIAFIRNGQPVAGVVGMPACGSMYLGGEGFGTVRRDASGEARLQVTSPSFSHPLRVIGSRSHAAAEMEVWLQQLHEPHVFIAAGSSLKFCRIAEGAADVYPRFGQTCQWDTAAGQCVLEMAGGKVSTFQGSPLCYGLDRPMLNPFFIARGGVR